MIYPGPTQPLSGVFNPPISGEYPPALMYRIFIPVSNSSCQTCEDNFVIQLAKE